MRLIEALWGRCKHGSEVTILRSPSQTRHLFKCCKDSSGRFVRRACKMLQGYLNELRSSPKHFVMFSINSGALCEVTARLLFPVDADARCLSWFKWLWACMRRSVAARVSEEQCLAVRQKFWKMWPWCPPVDRARLVSFGTARWVNKTKLNVKLDAWTWSKSVSPSFAPTLAS